MTEYVTNVSAIIFRHVDKVSLANDSVSCFYCLRKSGSIVVYNLLFSRDCNLVFCVLKVVLVSGNTKNEYRYSKFP